MLFILGVKLVEVLPPLALHRHKICWLISQVLGLAMAAVVKGC